MPESRPSRLLWPLCALMLAVVSGCARWMSPVVSVDLTRDYVRAQSQAGDQAFAATERVIGDQPLIALGTEVEILIDGVRDELAWGENEVAVASYHLADDQLRVVVIGSGNHAFRHEFAVTVPPGEGGLVLDLPAERLRRR